MSASSDASRSLLGELGGARGRAHGVLEAAGRRVGGRERVEVVRLLVGLHERLGGGRGRVHVRAPRGRRGGEQPREVVRDRRRAAAQLRSPSGSAARPPRRRRAASAMRARPTCTRSSAGRSLRDAPLRTPLARPRVGRAPPRPAEQRVGRAVGAQAPRAARRAPPRASTLRRRDEPLRRAGRAARARRCRASARARRRARRGRGRRARARRARRTGSTEAERPDRESRARGRPHERRAATASAAPLRSRPRARCGSARPRSACCAASRSPRRG